MQNKPSADTGRIARSAGTVSVAVMCSRVLGLVREQVFAALFGAGFAYDAFVVAFRIPNLLRDLFGEGALSSAFVTVFSEYDVQKGKEATWRLANNVLVFITLLLSCITILGMVFNRELVLFIVEQGFENTPGKVELTRKLATIMFPFLVFISLAAVVMGILNSKGRFFIPALASSFFNLGSIVGGIACSYAFDKLGLPAIMGMAVGTLIGGLLQLLCQVPALRKVGFIFRPVLDLRDPGLRKVLTLMVPAIVGLSATQLNVFVNNYFASSCMEGSISWLSYAFRLVQLPIGVFGVALSVATLPVLSRAAAEGDLARLRDTFSSSLIMAGCLTIPASVGLFLLARPIIRLLFEHGVFTATDTARTAEALAFYSLGLFAYAAVKVMVPVFYALNTTRYPVMGSFIAVGANILVILASVGRLGHVAMALSLSLSMTVNFFFLSTVLHKRLAGFSLRYLVNGFARVLAASLVMALWLWAVKGWLEGRFGAGITGQGAALALEVGSGAAVYGVALYFLRVREMAFLVDKMRARLGRAKAA